jgi:hypothetical protein
MFLKSELDVAAKTIMSMCTDYLMGGLSEDVFRTNLTLFADRAAQTVCLHYRSLLRMKVDGGDIVECVHPDCGKWSQRT